MRVELCFVMKVKAMMGGRDKVASSVGVEKYILYFGISFLRAPASELTSRAMRMSG